MSGLSCYRTTSCTRIGELANSIRLVAQKADQ